MRYGAASWHRPYGGEEGLGFGQGDGSVTGELEGGVVCANYPRRREDGVWTPNLRGTISAAAGDEILVSVHGKSVDACPFGWTSSLICPPTAARLSLSRTCRNLRSLGSQSGDRRVIG